MERGRVRAVRTAVNLAVIIVAVGGTLPGLMMMGFSDERE